MHIKAKAKEKAATEKGHYIQGSNNLNDCGLITSHASQETVEHL